MIDDLDQDLVELHEAGHAVAAAAYGVPFEYATSARFGGMRGHLLPRMTPALQHALELDPDTNPAASRILEKIAIVALAGPLAEGREPYGADLEKAERFAPDGDLVPVLMEARDFVRNYSAEIRRVAAALGLKDTLTEQAVLALVGS